MTFCVVFFDGWMDNTGFDIVVDHGFGDELFIIELSIF